MDRRIVSKHERRKIQFPVEGVGVDEAGKVFGNEFVHYLGLCVALRMIGGSGCVLNFEEFEEFVRYFSAKFFTVVSYYFERHAVPTYPSVEDGITYSGGFFIGKRENFRVFVECIGNAEDEFLAGLRCTKRAEEVSVNALIGGRTLRQRMEDVCRRGVVFTDELALLARFKVFGYIFGHIRPVITLENAFLRFGNTAVAGEEAAMGLFDHIGDEGSRKDEDGSSRVASAADAPPEEAVLDEASGPNHANSFGKRGVIG